LPQHGLTDIGPDGVHLQEVAMSRSFMRALSASATVVMLAVLVVSMGALHPPMAAQAGETTRVTLSQSTPQHPMIVQPITSATDASFLGREADKAGEELAVVGDVNGDGLDDFLLGAPLALNDDASSQPGRVYLILGRRDADWGQDFDLGAADASFIGEQTLQYTSDDIAGAGDVNGDGLDDMLIGAYRNSPSEGAKYGGKVYLVLGRRSADWGASFDLDTGADGSFIAEGEMDRLGQGMAGLGDVDGDGLGDILLGACGADGVDPDAGRAYLFLGRSAEKWRRDTPVGSADAIFLGERKSDYAGYAIGAPGDVDGDGLADMLIGAFGNDRNGSGAGRTYLIFGREKADWGQEFPLADADATFAGYEPQSRTGNRVTGAGDVNRDGRPDFAIGAPDSDAGGEDAGEVFLIFGKPRDAFDESMSLLRADASFIGAGDGEEAGRSLSAAGDVNGDGFGDFVIGAPGHNASSSVTETGRAYVVFGHREGWVRQRLLTDVAEARDILAIDGVEPGERLGGAVAGGGDVDGDGFSDLVLGAPEHWMNHSLHGLAHLVLGRGVSLHKSGPRVATVGQRVRYELSYTNTLRSALRRARIIDVPAPADAGLAFIGCSGGISCTRRGRSIVWDLGDIAPMSSATVGLEMRAPNDIPRPMVVTNTAFITSPLLLNPVGSLVRSMIVPARTPTAPGSTATATSATPSPATATASATSTPGGPAPTQTPQPGFRLFVPLARNGK